MTPRLIGIDPGVTGAVAYLGPISLEIVDMPIVDGHVDPYALADRFSAWSSWFDVDQVIVEKQQPMPRQGVTSTFKTGRNYGIILGVLGALRLPVTHVTPAVWTRALGVGADKNTHRRRAMDTWPDHAEQFRLAKHDGRADAALLALWGAAQNTKGAVA